MRLTKRMEDGSYQANQDDPTIPGENSYEYKNALITKLGKYEDQIEDPDLLKTLTFCCSTERYNK